MCLLSREISTVRINNLAMKKKKQKRLTKDQRKLKERMESLADPLAKLEKQVAELDATGVKGKEKKSNNPSVQ